MVSKKLLSLHLLSRPLFLMRIRRAIKPVSGLRFISKLVKCVVAEQLVDHIHGHGLDNSYQSAYKSGYSTETALLSTKNNIHLSLSQGEATALVLLDLSTAFDTIDHSTLPNCLHDCFGVVGSALNGPLLI